MNGDIFESAIRSTQDLAGVFEYDGETGYFYLYDTQSENGHKVLDAIHILTGLLQFPDSDVSVGWDESEHRVGFFIRGRLWAVFDTSNGSKHGGNYDPLADPVIPAEEVFTVKTMHGQAH